MSVNERTALLSATYNNNAVISGANENGHFVVHVSKDPEDYEQFFSPAHFSFALSLEELLPYKDDPWWQNVRRTLFYSFWLTFMIILLTASFLAFIQLDACQPLLAIAYSSTTASAVVTKLTP